MQPDRSPIVVIGAVEEARCPRSAEWIALWRWLLRPPPPTPELPSRRTDVRTDDRDDRET
jgi:hypothetical protein